MNNQLGRKKSMANKGLSINIAIHLERGGGTHWALDLKEVTLNIFNAKCVYQSSWD